MVLRITDGSEESGQGGQFAGRGCGTLFFGAFFAMGMLFVVLIAGESLKQAEPWLWPETPCTIVSSGVEETDDDESPYVPAVRFRYEFEGRPYEGTRVSRRQEGTSSYDRARNTSLRYPAGASATCRVNPDHPALAVLERTVPWIILVIFFPLIFVAIGAVGLWATWRRRTSSGNPDLQSLSQKAGGGKGHRFAVGLGLIFIVVGALVFAFLFALPAARTLDAGGWQATPCTVMRSTVRSWSTDDGTSYRPDVLYEYEAAGTQWLSNRVTFFATLSTGRDESRAVRDSYPRGASATCWVDPDEPSRSVLERGFRPLHLLGLLPLLFVIAGAGVVRWGWSRLQAEPSPGEPTWDMAEPAAAPVVLAPRVSPVGKVFGSLFFALFWNGIVSVFVWRAWLGWQSGDPDWFLTLFLVPFVLVGLGSIVFVGYFALALANPRPLITLVRGEPCLGDELQVEWRLDGRASRVGRLRIVVHGREEATYRRGTDTVTDRESFATLTVAETANDWEIQRGSAAVVIPDDTMHSFDAPSNKIVWEIKVAGEIERWPDVDQSFPLTVHPLPPGEV